MTEKELAEQMEHTAWLNNRERLLADEANADFAEPTLEEMLAASLREIMAQSGKPRQVDYRDNGLFAQHAREWYAAEQTLAMFDSKQTTE